MLHDHIVTCSGRLDNGLSSNSGATFRDTVPYTNEAERHFGLKPLNSNLSRPERNTAIASQKISANGCYSYVLDLHNKVIDSYKHATSFNQFGINLQHNGVWFKPLEKLRKNKQTGKYQYHFYNHPTNSGQYIKMTPKQIKNMYEIDPVIARNSNLKNHQNQYLRLKKHITYTFKDKTGKNRVIRTRKLGADTDVNAISRAISWNKKLQRGIAIPVQPQQKGTSDYATNSTGNTTSTPIQSKAQQQKKARQDPIKALGIHKTKKTFTYCTYSVDSNPYGPGEPHLRPMRLKNPVMKFQPKSHTLAKAIHDVTSTLNKIKNQAKAQDSSARVKEFMEQVYEDKLLKKSQIEKINEINNQNRLIAQKVYDYNRASVIAYDKQLKAYDDEIRREEYYRGFQR